MDALLRREVKAFAEAIEKIHQQTDLAQFPERIFEVVGGLFPGVFITSQEFNTRTKVARNCTSRPTPDGLMERSAELVPLEHPIFPALIAGATNPMRLSDFISQRQFQRTGLFQETFRPLAARHQLVLPLVLPDHVAGVTISRDRDFSDAEVCLAKLLAPHIAIAHLHAQHFTALRALQRDPVPGEDALRELGLTPREAEVLHWIIQGKRDGEIARIIGGSVRTVETHVRRILARLGVETRTAAAIEAVRRSASRSLPAT